MSSSLCSIYSLESVSRLTHCSSLALRSALGLANLANFPPLPCRNMLNAKISLLCTGLGFCTEVGACRLFPLQFLRKKSSFNIIDTFLYFWGPWREMDSVFPHRLSQRLVDAYGLENITPPNGQPRGFSWCRAALALFAGLTLLVPVILADPREIPWYVASGNWDRVWCTSRIRPQWKVKNRRSLSRVTGTESQFQWSLSL